MSVEQILDSQSYECFCSVEDVLITLGCLSEEHIPEGYTGTYLPTPTPGFDAAA